MIKPPKKGRFVMRRSKAIRKSKVMQKKKKELKYYKTKTAMFPEGKCPTCVEKEMIVHRLLENLPKPNEYSKGVIEHYYLLRKLSRELFYCQENTREEREYYAKIYSWADIFYRMTYGDVSEFYSLPPFPSISRYIKEGLDKFIKTRKKNNF